jgi:type VI secretion system secreted protein VgrG
MDNQEVSPTCSIRLESSAFDAEAIQLKSVHGTEKLGRLFEFEIVFATTAPDDLDANKLLAAGVTLAFYRGETVERRLHGRVLHVRRSYDSTTAFDTYTIQLGPNLWVLSTYRGQEIYMNMTVPEIIVQKLKTSDMGREGTDYELRLNGNYLKRDFVVQYGESDLDFVNRLAEHEGITIFFEHGAYGKDGWDHLAGRHGLDKVVLVDDGPNFRRIPGEDVVNFDQTGRETDVFALHQDVAIVPRLYWIRDYNYETPDHDLYGQHELDIDGAMGASVEFGSNVLSDFEAKRLAGVRAEEQRARQTRYVGKSDVMRLAAGSTFVLDMGQHGTKELLVIEVEHRSEMAVLTAAGDGNEIDYRNSFIAVDAAHTFRPARVTPVPRIEGLMTGVVRTLAHKKGDTMPDPPLAAIDMKGRYHVELHLDTPGRDASHQGGGEGVFTGVLASLPMRMAQPSVGRDYGIHMPLRAGTEVLVGFIGGDPDRPVIVGAVANATTPAVVGGKEPKLSRIKTQTGVLIQFGD